MLKRPVLAIIAILAMASWAIAVDVGYEPAVKQYVRGNYSAAVVMLMEYVEDTPDPDAYYLLGYAYYNLGKHQEANEFFEAAFLIDPDYSSKSLIKRLEAAKAEERAFTPKKKAAPKVEAKPAVKSPEKPVAAKAEKPAEVKPAAMAAANAPAAPTNAPAAAPEPSSPVEQKPAVAKVEPPKARPFYRQIIEDFGLLLLAPVAALYLVASLCLFLAARKLDVSRAWMAFIPILQILSYVKVILALIREGSILKKIMGVLLIIPGLNLLILVLVALSKKTVRPAGDEALGDYPEPEIPEAPGFDDSPSGFEESTQSFEASSGFEETPSGFEHESTVSMHPTTDVEQEPAGFEQPQDFQFDIETPGGEKSVDEESMTLPPWSEEGEAAGKTEDEPAYEMPKPEGEEAHPTADEFFRPEAGISEKSAGNKGFRLKILLIVLGVLLAVAVAATFILRGVLFSGQTAPPEAPKAAVAEEVWTVSWEDTEGDTVQDNSGRPRADIVEVKASGRAGLISIKARTSKDMAELLSFADKGGKQRGAMLLQYYIDLDNNADTGKVAVSADRVVKGYDYRVDVLAGHSVRDGAEVVDVTGDIEIDPAKTPVIDKTAAYRIWRMQNGALAVVEAAGIAKIEAASVEIRIPYEALGTKAGETVRVCFNEASQRLGAGFSEDKTLKLEGGDAPQKSENKRPWEDFLMAAEKGDVASVGSMAASVSKALYEAALYRASLGGHADVLKYLLEKGASPNVADRAGQTPLFLSVVGRKPEMVDMLVSKGADVNAKTVTGETALIRAVAWGDAQIVQTLIKSGAKTNVKSESGYTPLKLAQDAKRADIVKLLKSAKNG